MPDRAQALRQYRRRAAGYDRGWSSRAVARVRRRALERLDLTRGAVVLDVACGTGVNFTAIQRAVGPGGRLIGVELSPEMLDVARARVETAGWRNVELIQAAVEEADLPAADAALLSYTHDVLRSPDALQRVLDAVRPGGRVVAAGLKAMPWGGPVNAGLRRIARGYVTTFDGFDEPWDRLAAGLSGVRVEAMMLGSAFVVSGRVGADLVDPTRRRETTTHRYGLDQRQ
jgi:ubiquinone/menaquinone biosynthesis C-methylase UbiE